MFCIIAWFLVFGGWIVISVLFGFIGFFIGLTATVISIPALIWWGLAPNNLFFTFVKEGTAKVIVKGGEFSKSLIQYRGYTLDNDWHVDKEGEGEEEKNLFGGLRFYGFWPIWDVYIYNFQWTGIKENGELDPHPKEILDYILLKDDVYGCKVEKAEDEELLPLDVSLALTLRIVNPYKALFVTQNWYETVMNRIRPYVRDFITTGAYEELIEKPARIGKEVWKKLKKGKILDEFENRYGVELRNIEVKDIDPGDEYRNATLAKWTAEREREKKIVEGNAEAQWIEEVYGAVQKFDDLGRLIRTLSAVEKSPLAASLAVQAVPGIQEVLKGIFGKGADQVSPEEIMKLREVLEKLEQKLA